MKGEALQFLHSLEQSSIFEKKQKTKQLWIRKKKENQEERTQSGSPNGATKLQLPFCGISS